MGTSSVTCWPPEVCLAELIIQTQASYNYTTNIALHRFCQIQIGRDLTWLFLILNPPKNDFIMIPISLTLSRKLQ